MDSPAWAFAKKVKERNKDKTQKIRLLAFPIT